MSRVVSVRFIVVCILSAQSPCSFLWLFCLRCCSFLFFEPNQSIVSTYMLALKSQLVMGLFNDTWQEMSLSWLSEKSSIKMEVKPVMESSIDVVHFQSVLLSVGWLNLQMRYSEIPIFSHKSRMRTNRDAGMKRIVRDVQPDFKALVSWWISTSLMHPWCSFRKGLTHANRALESIRYSGRTDAVIKSTDCAGR